MSTRLDAWSETRVLPTHDGQDDADVPDDRQQDDDGEDDDLGVVEALLLPLPLAAILAFSRPRPVEVILTKPIALAGRLVAAGQTPSHQLAAEVAGHAPEAPAHALVDLDEVVQPCAVDILLLARGRHFPTFNCFSIFFSALK